MHVGFRHAHAQRLGDHAQPVRRRRADGGADGVVVVAGIFKAGNLDLVEAGQAGFKGRAAPSAAIRQRYGRSP